MLAHELEVRGKMGRSEIGMVSGVVGGFGIRQEERKLRSIAREREVGDHRLAVGYRRVRQTRWSFQAAEWWSICEVLPDTIYKFYIVLRKGTEPDAKHTSKLAGTPSANPKSKNEWNRRQGSSYDRMVLYPTIQIEFQPASQVRC